MIYYNTTITQNKPYLELDGVNDFVESVTPIQSWGNQSYTFFLDIDIESSPNFAPIIENFVQVSFERTIYFSRISNTEFSWYEGNTPYIFPYQDGRFQISISYDASILSGNNAFVYTNTGGLIASFELSGFQSVLHPITIGLDSSIPTEYLKAKLYNISFVNYAKTQIEINNDFSNKIQSKGTGEFLFKIDFIDFDNESTFNTQDSNSHLFQIIR